MFENVFIWAQVIAAAAIIIQLFAMQIKDPKKMILMHFPAGLLWALQFMLLNAPLATSYHIVAALKDLLVGYAKEEYLKYILGGFVAFIWALGIYFFKEWYDVIPLLCGTFFSIVLLQRDSRFLISRAVIIHQISWMAYNYIVGSWGGLLCCILVMASTLVGMARHEEWKIATTLPALIRSLTSFNEPRTYP